MKRSGFDALESPASTSRGAASSVATAASYASVPDGGKCEVILSSPVFLLSRGRRKCLEKIFCDTLMRGSMFWIVFWLEQTGLKTSGETGDDLRRY